MSAVLVLNICLGFFVTLMMSSPDLRGVAEPTASVKRCLPLVNIVSGMWRPKLEEAALWFLYPSGGL